MMKKFLLVVWVALMLLLAAVSESQARERGSLARNRRGNVRVVWRIVALTPQYQIAKAILGGGRNGSSCR